MTTQNVDQALSLLAPGAVLTHDREQLAIIEPTFPGSGRVYYRTAEGVEAVPRWVVRDLLLAGRATVTAAA